MSTSMKARPLRRNLKNSFFKISIKNEPGKQKKKSKVEFETSLYKPGKSPKRKKEKSFNKIGKKYRDCVRRTTKKILNLKKFFGNKMNIEEEFKQAQIFTMEDTILRNLKAKKERMLKEIKKPEIFSEEINNIIKEVSHKAKLFSPEIYRNIRTLSKTDIPKERVIQRIKEFVKKFKKRYEEKQLNYHKFKMLREINKKLNPSQSQILGFLNYIKAGDIEKIEVMIKIFGENIVNACDYVKFLINFRLDSAPLTGLQSKESIKF